MEAPRDTQRAGLVGLIEYNGRYKKSWRSISVYPFWQEMVWQLKIDGKRVEPPSPPKGILRVYVNPQNEGCLE